MKRIVIIIYSLLIFGSFMSAQTFYSDQVKKTSLSIEMANLTTRSIYGWSTGFTVGVDVNNRMTLSYVNLTEIGGDENGSQTFRGAQYQYFFNPLRRLNIGVGITAGMYDQQFLSVVPSIQARYLHNNRWVIGLGLARVETYPQFDFKVGVRLFK